MHADKFGETFLGNACFEAGFPDVSPNVPEHFPICHTPMQNMRRFLLTSKMRLYDNQ